MSALDLIIEWSANDLPPWESDAVRRILTQEELTDDDKDEIFNMLKKEFSLIGDDEKTQKPIPIKAGDVSGSNDSPKITLKAIQNLQNVNAIQNGASLPFGHSGLTVIYGENGVGKSGYARVLKRACRARDKNEPILANVFSDEEACSSTAEFKIGIDGDDKTISWQDNEESPPILSNISVFDSKCARLILNDNNEAVYLPYGTFVFSELVKLIRDFRERLNNEKPKIEKLDYPDIPAETKVGKLLGDISYITKIEEINNVPEWKEKDEASLTILDKKLIEAKNPAEEAKKRTNIVARTKKLNNDLRDNHKWLSNKSLKEYKDRLDSYDAASKAYKISKNETDLGSEPLQDAGGKEWQILYNAAKAYSTTSAYPGSDFPYMSDKSLCVLCMQELGDDAKDRMRRFKKYMEDKTKLKLDKESKLIDAKKEILEKIKINLPEEYKDVLDEIDARNNALNAKIKILIEFMDKRPKSIIESFGVKDLAIIEKLETSVSINTENDESEEKVNIDFDEFYKKTKDELLEVIDIIEKEAIEIESTEDKDKLKLLENEKNELISRKNFILRKQKIIQHVENLKLIKRYDDCIGSTDHRKITSTGKKIVSQALTPQLQSNLEEELSKVGLSYLPLNLKGSGSEGRTRHQLEIKDVNLPKNTNLTEVLSEGEQCIVSISGFLAELNTGDHCCPIVFDDPVSSLGHRFRVRIAKRLAEESLVRQVIIFTHDIAFLNEIEDQISQLPTSKFTSHTIIKPNETTVGKYKEGLPWHAMAVTDRFKYLKEELARITPLEQSDVTSYNKEAAQIYGLIRETWEAMIEEELFNKVVRKHLGHTQMLRLSEVSIELSDYDIIDMNYSKCSTWMTGHEKSKSLDQNRPKPNEINNDIDELEEFKKTIRKRKKNIKVKREHATNAKTPNIG